MAGRRKKSRSGSPAGSRAVDDGRSKRLKTAKGRRLSSSRWLTRQLRDPYVAAARTQGFRSRAAFKLMELDDRFRFLKPGGQVVDLGAAPGGWSQVAAVRVKGGRPGGGRVVAVDCEEMDAIAGVGLVTLDFLSDDSPARIRAALDGPADVVLSDLAAPARYWPSMVMSEMSRTWSEFRSPGAWVCWWKSPGDATARAERPRRATVRVRA